MFVAFHMETREYETPESHELGYCGLEMPGTPICKKKIKGLGILCALRHWSGNEMPDKQSL